MKDQSGIFQHELIRESREAKLSTSMRAADQIASLQNQGDTFTRRIELEKKKIEISFKCLLLSS
jgi:hypothetical protein